MLLYEKSISIPKTADDVDLLAYLHEAVSKQVPSDEIPVRFVITRTDDNSYHCELGILAEIGDYPISTNSSIFDFKKRTFENSEQFNAVLLVPTGIGAAIGGDAGDAGPVARLLANACDNLITHPNVVNASDINELPDNGLYVEGSVITRFITGSVGLQKVRSNRVLLVIDKHEDPFFQDAAINSVSAARASFGIDCPAVVTMDEKITMLSFYSPSGRAVGGVNDFERLCEVLEKYRADYDAVALSSVIKVPSEFHLDYFKKENMVNPWGGVEAMLTHAVSHIFNIPSAHSPMMESKEILNLEVGVVDPRKAAEAVSTTYLHCILKGLHRSPRIIDHPSLDGSAGFLSVTDISCLIIPDGCVGIPTMAALEQGIPVIAVKENKNKMQNQLEDMPFATGKLFVVENYLEAVGVMHAIRSGVALESVRRPLDQTVIVESNQDSESSGDSGADVIQEALCKKQKSKKRSA